MKRITLFSLALVFVVVAFAARPVKVGVLLPFTGSDARGGKMIEFYRGVLMAADSIAAAYNADVDVTAFDCGTTPSDMGYLLALNDEVLANVDVIIGPQNAQQIPALAEFCDIHHVRLVVPFATDESLLKGHPCMYMVTAARTSATWHNELGVLLTSQMPRDNVVVVRTGESGAARLVPQAIERAYSQRGIFVSQLGVEATEDAVKAVVKEDVRNIFVVDGTTLESVNKTLSMLDAFGALYPDYQMTLVGNMDWTGYLHHHMRNFLRYDAYLPVTFYRNASNPSVASFENSYMSAFRTAPINSSPRFAHMGYDVAWFFINAIYKWGDEMEHHLSEAYFAQRPLQHGLYFERISNADGGYVNRSARFVHYAPDGAINIISR